MKNIIYSKYSNERAEKFKIRTDILEDLDGKKYVQKVPLTKEASIHIDNIYRYYELLSEAYKESQVCINKCLKNDVVLEFEFISGITLEEELDKLLSEKNYTQIIEKIKEYVLIIGKGIGENTFKITEDFRNVFGDVELPMYLRAGNVNNIDLVFGNIILGDKWNIIDYEWTFDFQIPFNYIIYRAVHYYIYSSSKRNELTDLELFKILGITDEEIVQYDNMEKNFQAYILGGLMPLRDIYETTVYRNINVQQVIESKAKNDLKNTVQVFFDYGNGFDEKQSCNYLLDKDGKIDFEIPIASDIKQVRVDPINGMSVVNINRVVGYNKENYSVEYTSNGIKLYDKTVLFKTDDPQIVITNIKPDTTKIKLKIEAQIIPEEIIVELDKFLLENYKLIQDKERMIVDKDKIIQGYKEKIEEKEKHMQDINSILENYKMHYHAAIEQRDNLTIRLAQREAEYNIIVNSASWKITKPIRVILDYAKKVLKSNRHTRMLCKGLKCLKNNGIKYTIRKLKFKLKAAEGYKEYAMQNLLSEEEKIIQSKTKFNKKIKFSIIVPIYNTPKSFLCEMINSCIDQTYENWELCLADGSDKDHGYVSEIIKDYIRNDKRIKYKSLEKNRGISENTNECIKMATGEYIALFDHDDVLHPSALFEYMKAICEKNADFIYCDEDKFERNIEKCFDPYFKPDFAIDNLRTNNYICHFTVFKKNLLNEVGQFRKEFDGSQDHDMILRLTEKAKSIVHIPKILYHWRMSSNSVASDPYAKPYTIKAGIEAVKQHLDRCNLNATVESSTVHPNFYRIRYDIIGNPLISILIPNKDHIVDLSRCINSIIEKSTYKNIEIIVIENNSVELETFDYYKTLEKYNNIKVVTYESNGKFNYSAINNFGVKYAKGEHLLFLNNDIEIISENWLEEMLMYSQREDVGAVGAKLYYPNDTLQHAGVILGLGGVAGHSHKYFDRNSYGYFGRCVLQQNLSAVTAACLMMKKDIFNEIDGFDEAFAVAFNDVDLCMRIRDAGYLIAWTPYAEAYHYESISRGYEDTPEKQARFNGEIIRFKTRWGKQLEQGDPYYNPNLTLEREDFSLR